MCPRQDVQEGGTSCPLTCMTTAVLSGSGQDFRILVNDHIPKTKSTIYPDQVRWYVMHDIVLLTNEVT